MITVVDTSTWVNAFVFGGVEEAAVTKALSLGAIGGCGKLWHEIQWVLTRKFNFPPDLIIEDLVGFRMFSIDVEIDGSIRGSKDPDDDFVLECAVRAKARAIVSNDLKHLVSLGSFECIPILTPEEFLLTPFAENEEEAQQELALIYGNAGSLKSINKK